MARGAGTAPCIAIAEVGRKDRFIGPAFLMSADTELHRYVEQMGARWLPLDQLPAGGRGVELFDPSGRSVWLLQDQRRVEPLPLRDAVTPSTNTAQDTPRVNRTVRTPIEPARVVRLGHVVLQTVDFARLAEWYLRVLGVIPTDMQYRADGSPGLAFCRLDLGNRPADHHTLVIVSGIEEKYEHSAYEVLDLDAIGQGPQVLRAPRGTSLPTSRCVIKTPADGIGIGDRAQQAFAPMEPAVASVASDDEGVMVDNLVAQARATAGHASEDRARLVYLLPNFQNPTGRTERVQCNAAGQMVLS